MNKRLKAILLMVMLLITVLLITSCSSGDDASYYDDYEKDGYTVSIRFDANGGEFTTSTSSIVDTYNLSSLPSDEGGNKKLMLVSPDNEVRGSSNTFSVYNPGYFFAGWYQERTLIMTDDEGNEIYGYSGKWDFSTPLTVDPDESYSAKEPIMTLYAAWLPQFTVNYYDRATEELLCTYTLTNPMQNKEVMLPTWNETTGAMDYNSMIGQYGYTFSKAYYDKEGTSPIEGDTFQHHGSVIERNATAALSTMDVYVDRIEGTWFKIKTAQQLIDNASISSCYEILGDLDFTGLEWPKALSSGVFNGTITAASSYTIKNVSVEQTDSANTNFALFGQIGQNATIENISFENITVSIKAGTLKTPARYGLFSGMISYGATVTNVTVSGKLLVSADFAPAAAPGSKKGDCTLSLIGEGDTKNIGYENITFGVIEGTEYSLTLTQDGNSLVYEQTRLPKEQTESA